METDQSSLDVLLKRLRDILGSEAVSTLEPQLRLYSADLYADGASRCAAVIRPSDRQGLASAVSVISEADYAIVCRGGGLSYTNGYTPIHPRTIVVDMAALDRIIALDEASMYVTVEAGTTWKQLYDVLKPRGLRLPFFGTFSGAQATVGGGLSQGALFLGTARYGQAADIVLGLEVLLPDGRLVRTGQKAFKNGTPTYRGYGPDLTGMFLHDGGALGIKTAATLRLIEAPEFTDYASFVFPTLTEAVAALCDVARSGAAEDAYAFDPVSTAKNLQSHGIAEDLRTLSKVVRTQRGLLKGIHAGAKLALAGRRFAPQGLYSLHTAGAGRSLHAVKADMGAIRTRAVRNGGTEIPNSIPKAVRADPFPPLNGVLGSKGERWVALNAKFAHAEAPKAISEIEAVLGRHATDLEAHGVSLTRLMIAISNHSFSYEPVFHWSDEWLPLHRSAPEPSHLKSLGAEPAANPAARALVHEVRRELVQLFSELGAASNQIGKLYPYLDSLESNTRELVQIFKTKVDPGSHLNPGVLGLGR